MVFFNSGGVPSAPSKEGVSSLSHLLGFLSTSPSSSAQSEDSGVSGFPNYDGSHIEIMPGSGINAKNVSDLLRTLLPLGIRSLHLSGGCLIDGALSGSASFEDPNLERKETGRRKKENITQTVTEGMLYRPIGMNMGAGGEVDWKVWRTNTTSIQAVRHAVDQEWFTFTQNRI